MDHLTVVTVAGKSIVIATDKFGRTRIVKVEKILTATGAQWANSQDQQQFLFLTLASPPPR
jgi:hypothetical protein